MWYQDPLYGMCEFPEIVESLLATPQFGRLHEISMDTLPRNVVPYGVVSRFEHSLGVVRLALDAIENNRRYLPEGIQRLLIVSALFHDVGNPPLSHLTEPFLRYTTGGKDGESFLEDVLAGSKAAAIIERYGISPSAVVAMVTGRAEPYSDILHGSMDLDNLDNVNRYHFAATGEKLFDARLIASSYRFRKNRWELDMNCLEESRKWQDARRTVYARIYGDPHLGAASMAYRAADLVFQEERSLPSVFFRLNDTEAFEFLETNDEAKHLIDCIFARRWYKEVRSIETIVPERSILRFADSEWNARGMVAGYLAAEAGIPPWAVCAYIGRGRDARRIHLPFINRRGDTYWDKHKPEPIFRLKVYAHPEYADELRLRVCVGMFMA